MGLPEIYKLYAGAALGLARGPGAPHVASQLRAGVFRDVGSPITEVLGAAVEGYVGVRDVRLDHGVRGFLVSNLFGVGAGVDVDTRDGETDLLLTALLPGRRGGTLTRGSELRLEWLPTRHGALHVALNFPIRQPNRGSTRRPRDHVVLRDVPPRAVRFSATEPTLAEALGRVRESARWINSFTLPPLGRRSGDSRRTVRAALAPVTARLVTRTVEQEIREYHRELARAFSIAVSGVPPARSTATPLGEAVARRAKVVVLDRVVFPYNRLVGQKKRKDTTREFGWHARGVFARWLVTESGVDPAREQAVLYVFQTLLDVIEETRAANAAAWKDSRLVWLPLQLTLEPEQHDEQEELDTLISRAVAHPITHGNRIWYVHNDRFQRELIKSIGRAEEYHVLWVHDFRGVTEQGRPDRLSLLLVTQSYLAALRECAARYDSVGRMPAYMIFLDQHYFELNRSRQLFELLQDPLGSRFELPDGYASLEQEVRDAQDRLRETVAASRLLTAERAQYGDRWLHHLVKVHVSVTNPADPTFRSREILPLVGVPDDLMRDHRKVVLYDVSEDDPYAGMAMYAGMGVGEHYAGPAWEDRALMLQGPGALTLRDEARALLEVQGIRGGAVPHVLRQRRKPADYNGRVRAEIDSMDRWGGVASRAVELHNQTGFASKEIAVGMATLFNLMSPGGVLKAPDSLWLNELIASLLTASALRGVRVLIIAPSRSGAPAPGWALPLMHDLLSRLLAAREVLAPGIAKAGGLFQIGLYGPDIGVDDLPRRVQALRTALARNSMLRGLYAFDPAVYHVLDSAEAIVGTPRANRDDPPATADVAVRPKLHFKGFLYVSREGWTQLIGGRPMAQGLQEYLAQRALQLREPQVGESVLADAMQQVGAIEINRVLENIPQHERRRLAFFLQVGSPNLNYRSMVMDGEAAVLVSGWTSLYAFPDFLLLTGISTWIEDQAELDRRLPPASGLKHRLARWVRMGL